MPRGFDALTFIRPINPDDSFLLSWVDTGRDGRAFQDIASKGCQMKMISTAAALGAAIATTATAQSDPMEWVNTATCQGMIDGMRRPENTTIGNMQGMMDHFARVGAISAYVAGFEQGRMITQLEGGAELTARLDLGPIVAQICQARPDMLFTDAVATAAMM